MFGDRRDPFAGPSFSVEFGHGGRVGPWFTASYDSECTGCYGDCPQGEQARYVDGGVVCAECGENP